ncbi:MAG: hypothetical protein AAFR61_24020 [Bacteroidota bacterium]
MLVSKKGKTLPAPHRVAGGSLFEQGILSGVQESQGQDQPKLRLLLLSEDQEVGQTESKDFRAET